MRVQQLQAQIRRPAAASEAQLAYSAGNSRPDPQARCSMGNFTFLDFLQMPALALPSSFPRPHPRHARHASFPDPIFLGTYFLLPPPTHFSTATTTAAAAFLSPASPAIRANTSLPSPHFPGPCDFGLVDWIWSHQARTVLTRAGRRDLVGVVQRLHTYKRVHTPSETTHELANRSDGCQRLITQAHQTRFSFDLPLTQTLFAVFLQPLLQP